MKKLRALGLLYQVMQRRPEIMDRISLSNPQLFREVIDGIKVELYPQSTEIRKVAIKARGGILSIVRTSYTKTGRKLRFRHKRQQTDLIEEEVFLSLNTSNLVEIVILFAVSPRSESFCALAGGVVRAYKRRVDLCAHCGSSGWNFGTPGVGESFLLNHSIQKSDEATDYTIAGAMKDLYQAIDLTSKFRGSTAGLSGIEILVKTAIGKLAIVVEKIKNRGV